MLKRIFKLENRAPNHVLKIISCAKVSSFCDFIGIVREFALEKNFSKLTYGGGEDKRRNEFA